MDDGWIWSNDDDVMITSLNDGEAWPTERWWWWSVDVGVCIGTGMMTRIWPKLLTTEVRLIMVEEEDPCGHPADDGWRSWIVRASTILEPDCELSVQVIERPLADPCVWWLSMTPPNLL